jgi:site-specific DNA-methyltransferase (adenine-specific)
MRQPDYERGGVRLYCGDCREVLRHLDLSGIDAVVTDPVWPNACVELPGHDDPYGLLKQALFQVNFEVSRIVVHLGCNSDPRILKAVPSQWPFLRVCWLEYARPNYKGRLLYTGDVAYVFGQPPPARCGAMVLPGKCIHTDGKPTPKGHPCPRQLQHVEWLTRWFVERSAVDPFMGTGATGVACLKQGKQFIGIEIEPKYFDIACARVDAAFEETALLDHAAAEQLTLEAEA